MPTWSPFPPTLCSTDNDCHQFVELDSWNEEFVSSLCSDDGVTDKSVDATLCWAYAGNIEYENGLKLAILNTMYGTTPIPPSGQCAHFCMYHPLRVTGADANGFKWSTSGGCWNVMWANSDPLCYENSVLEWTWARVKANNWCCTSEPILMPSISPTLPPYRPVELPSMPPALFEPTLMPSNSPTTPPTLMPTWSPFPPTLCSTDNDCHQFVELDSWNEEFVSSLCSDDGVTDKSVDATLCWAYAGNIEYENGLKLAILNTMYGTTPIPPSGQCAHFCMYHPLRVTGADANGFKWSTSGGCWNVMWANSDPLCYENSVLEWTWARVKANNWCCTSEPILMPSISPTLPPYRPVELPSMPPALFEPTLMPSNSPTTPPTWPPFPPTLCSTDNDCHQFVELDSWNEEFVSSLCSDDGLTDKSVNATLCPFYAGNIEYENGLKLAILNTMYGTTPIPPSGQCAHFCMYHPLHVIGDDAIGFKWSTSGGCWKVHVGSNSSPLCYELSLAEWEWSSMKSENLCCTSSPTYNPTPLTAEPTITCKETVLWSQERADESCPGNAHHAYGVGLCDTYDNPDYQRRLDFALANELYSSCSHSCLYDYESYNTTKQHAFFWKGSCYNVQLGKWSCIDDQVSSLELANNHAATLCVTTASCLERIAWTPEVDENNCPNGYSGKNKGYGTAKVCSKLVRLNNGYYGKADDLYQSSFNLSLANHVFWSCSAKCIYDIENEGVVYQWKGEGCWEMQTNWACITIHSEEYAWALEYVSKKLCPIATPAPTAFTCVERVQLWDEATALKTCPNDEMGFTDKSSNAVMCTGFEDYQWRLDLSLANRVFLMCDAWCVYDIYMRAHEAFIWRSNEQCYNPVTHGLCIGGNPSHRQQMTDYVENMLCESSTPEPTEACMPYNPWSEVRAEELCPTMVQPDKSYGIQVCDGTDATQKKLDDSLANQFYRQCTSWCVYDYGTLINNIETGSSDNGGFLWQDSASCWKWVTGGHCFTDATNDLGEVSSRAKTICLA